MTQSGASAQQDSRTYFELAPLLPVSEWWQVLVLLTISILIVGISVRIYRRDTAALSRLVATTLLVFRLLALFGILVFFLGPEKRSETKIISPSRLAVMVDTSLSMGLSDHMGSEGNIRRIDPVVELLQDSTLLTELNRQHEVSIYRFGEGSQPLLVATSPRKMAVDTIANPEGREINTGRRWLALSNRIGMAGWIGLLVSLVLLLATVVLKTVHIRNVASSNSMALGSLLLVVTIFTLAVADLLTSQYPFSVSTGLQTPGVESEIESPPVATETTGDSTETVDLTAIDWSSELAPEGISTRLGSAIQSFVNQNRGSALAGIVLLTDGQHNQGTPPARAIAAASDANIPIYVVGAGSNQAAQNVRISDLEAPHRVFPGNRFQVKAIIQSVGLQGESVRVHLSSTDEEQSEPSVTEDEQTIQLVGDGEPVTVTFELSRQEEGRRRYAVQLDPPPNDLDATDNHRSAVVQVLLRKSRVLLIAGGPTRDFQFLRNHLFRDESIHLDVWLQMARPGADQESDQLLFSFPETSSQLDQYDCIVAFDPDWQRLSVEQTRWLERWVSVGAGGILVIAGPVFTPEWTRLPRGNASIDLIRNLYPVSFYSQGSAALKLGRFGGTQPFPLEFSREGRTAKHLWLGESSADSIANWERFDGVFGFYAVNEPKAGAELLALFSDPSTAVNNQLPIYMASQFYGAGRVFFQASGEVWRLRTLDVEYFQSYYLNLIRWVSEGRMLRDSNRGVLLLDRNRCWAGDQVTVRAILRDASDQPLMQPQIQATVRGPNNMAESLTLVNIQDATQPGTFVSQFVTSLEGTYDVSLPIPRDPDDRVLRGSVQASIPDLEKVRPERHDILLQEIADRTGGRYFYDLSSDGHASWKEAGSGQETPKIEKRGSLVDPGGLGDVIGVVDQETYLPGSPDEDFITRFSRWILFWLVLVLCTEWIVRRLHKLA